MERKGKDISTVNRLKRSSGVAKDVTWEIRLKEEIEEAISYFKKYPVYDKLFAVMRKKYASLGHLGGVFVLTGLAEGDRVPLSGFLGIDLGQGPLVRISFSALSKALAKSRFSALTWEDILVRYSGKALLVRKEEQLQRQEERKLFWESWLAQCKTEDVKIWLSGVLLEHRQGYRALERQYAVDKETAGNLLKNVLSALEQLPINKKKKQFLPVFAAEITGNPHYFDDGTTACKLLLNYGAYRFGQADIALSGVEQRESLLYQMGILRDEMSNACLAYNVMGWKEDGCIHEGLQGFFREKQAFQLTLNVLGRLKRLESAKGCHHRVYIVENPAVFSWLTQKYPENTFLCTMGQLKLAAYVMLDLFAETDILYYAGDFDPDGLQIAQGLKKRYGRRLRLWNYNRRCYEQAVSDVEIDHIGMTKLEKIDLPELQEIRQCLLQFKKVAYQERMLTFYVMEGESCQN